MKHGVFYRNFQNLKYKYVVNNAGLYLGQLPDYPNIQVT